MTEQNEEIVSNLKILIAAVKAQPEALFNLRYFRKDEACGTLFCTAGLACTMPEFQEKGLVLEVYETEWCTKAYAPEMNGESIFDSNEVDTIFGDESYSRLFESRGAGEWDCCRVDGWEIYTTSITDKELALWRLEQQLAIYDINEEVV